MEKEKKRKNRGKKEIEEERKINRRIEEEDDLWSVGKGS